MSRRARRLAAATAAGVVAAVSVSVAVVSSHHGSSSTTSSTTTPAQRREHDAAVAWLGAVDDAFGPGMTDAVTSVLTGAPDWERAALSDSDFRGRVALAVAQLRGARDRMIGLAGFALSPLVKSLTVRSTELSLEAMRSFDAAAAAPPGDVRLQLDLEGRRLQELATRIFDRAQAIVGPYLHQAAPVETVEPAEVPSWTETGLAPGPPLDPTPPASTGQFQPRQPSRPTEPRAAWLARIRDLAVPGGPAVAAALQSTLQPALQPGGPSAQPSAQGDTAAPLRSLADSLQAAADALGTEPDPAGPGGREESARDRLGLLIRADAARMGELAVLGPPARTAAVGAAARRLVLLADGLDPPELAVPPSGLDPALLTSDT